MKDRDSGNFPEIPQIGHMRFIGPIFVNTCLPPLPKPRRCEALGKAILKVIEKRGEKVAIIASGGMSHYPGTPQPACSE